MGLKDFAKGLFNVNGSMIKDGAEGVSTLAKGLRTAVTGEADPDRMAEIQLKAIELDAATTELKAKIIAAEAQGESFLQRNWRPLVMIWFAVLISLNWFGLRPENMSDQVLIELMKLLKIGLGGYVIGQSAEQIADKWNKT